jgi:toxin CcdB
LPQQLDIVENRNSGTRGNYPFLIVLQSDRVSSFNSLIAAPLARANGPFARSRIHPQVEVAGVPYVVLSERLAAIQTSTLGRVVGSAAANRYEIIAALDMLFTGI